MHLRLSSTAAAALALCSSRSSSAFHVGAGGAGRGSDARRQESRTALKSSGDERWRYFSRSMEERWGLADDDDDRTDFDVEFPSTPSQVVNAAFDAISGALSGNEPVDPNLVLSAASPHRHVPVRRASDAGRIGIELDGLEELYPDGETPQRAMRRISLNIAAKLVDGASWKRKRKDPAPVVAVYFNTIKQTLMAADELNKIKREEADEDMRRALDGVLVKTLGDDIPNDLKLDRSKRRRYGGLSEGYVDGKRGMIIIVQPTDFNDEYLPPGPSLGAIPEMQKLVARASIEEVPSIVISPRFLSNADSSFYNSWDTPGVEQAATYGGVEPPLGPMPWVMRDFAPPCMCWIGDALASRRRRRRRALEPGTCAATVAMFKSTQLPEHQWNLFAIRRCNESSRETTKAEYLISTKSKRGRPTRQLLNHLLEKHLTVA